MTIDKTGSYKGTRPLTLSDGVRAGAAAQAGPTPSAYALDRNKTQPLHKAALAPAAVDFSRQATPAPAPPARTVAPEIEQELVSFAQLTLLGVDEELVQEAIKLALTQVSPEQIHLILNSLSMVDPADIEFAMKALLQNPSLLNRLAEMPVGNPEQIKREMEALPRMLEVLSRNPLIGITMPVVERYRRAAHVYTNLAVDVARQQEAKAELDKIAPELDKIAARLMKLPRTQATRDALDSVEGLRRLLDSARRQPGLTYVSKIRTGLDLLAHESGHAGEASHPLLVEEIRRITENIKAGPLAKAAQLSNQRMDAAAEIAGQSEAIHDHFDDGRAEVREVEALLGQLKATASDAERVGLIDRIKQKLAHVKEAHGITLDLGRKLADEQWQAAPLDQALALVGRQDITWGFRYQPPPSPGAAERAPGAGTRVIPPPGKPPLDKDQMDGLLETYEARRKEGVAEQVVRLRLKEAGGTVRDLADAIKYLEKRKESLPAGAPERAEHDRKIARLDLQRKELLGSIKNLHNQFKDIDHAYGEVENALLLLNGQVRVGGRQGSIERLAKSPSDQDIAAARATLAAHGIVASEKATGKWVFTYNGQGNLDIPMGKPMNVYEMRGNVSRCFAESKLALVTPPKTAELTRLQHEMQELAATADELRSLEQTLTTSPDHQVARARLAELLKRFRGTASGDVQRDLATLGGLLLQRQVARQERVDQLKALRVQDIPDPPLAMLEASDKAGLRELNSAIDNLDRYRDQESDAHADSEFLHEYRRGDRSNPEHRARYARTKQKYADLYRRDPAHFLPVTNSDNEDQDIDLLIQVVERRVVTTRTHAEEEHQRGERAYNGLSPGAKRGCHGKRLRLDRLYADIDRNFGAALRALGRSEAEIATIRAGIKNGTFDPATLQPIATTAESSAPDKGPAPAGPAPAAAPAPAAESPAPPAPSTDRDKESFFRSFTRSVMNMFGTTADIQSGGPEAEITEDALRAHDVRRQQQQQYQERKAQRREDERRETLEKLSEQEADRRLKDAGLRRKDLGEQVHDQVVGTHDARQQQIEQDRRQGRR